MNPQHEHELRLLQMRFIGKIIAGFTHEIKNYIAIINESTGLMGDMMKLGKLSETDLPAYLDIIHSIEDHIDKTNLHFRYLNRFAHRMDTPTSSFRIDECVEELIALVTRFANQKRIRVIQDVGSEFPPLTSNPSLLQLVMFSYIDKGIMELDQGSSIRVRTSASDGGVSIRISREGNRTGGGIVPLPSHLIDAIVQELGGRIVEDTESETVLMLPMQTL